MAMKKNNRAVPENSDEDPEIKAILAQYKKEFTAADLQKYAEIEEGIPADLVLAEMEQIHRNELRRMKGKKG